RSPHRPPGRIAADPCPPGARRIDPRPPRGHRRAPGRSRPLGPGLATRPPQADCKGIVMRGQGMPTVCGGERPGGQRASHKRMATLAAVYTVDPYVRTPEEVVAALFRDPDYEPGPRPEPCHKRVWASLPPEGPAPRSSIAVVFDWVWWEFAQRNPRLTRPTVCLCDG